MVITEAWPLNPSAPIDPHSKTTPTPLQSKSPGAALMAPQPKMTGIAPTKQRGMALRLQLAGFFVMTAGCLLWTLWLLLLTIDPKGTVNRVMNTTSYDDGSFWLLTEPAVSLVIIGTSGLALVAVSYAFVLVKACRSHRHAAAPVVPSTDLTSRTGSRVASAVAHRVSLMRAAAENFVAHVADDSSRGIVVKSIAKLTTDVLAGRASSARKQAHVVVKLADIGIQVVLLYQILEAAYPLALVVVFAAIVALNSVASAVMILDRPRSDRQVVEVLVETVFDFLVAVGFPVLIVSYCLSTFKFDRAKLAINMAIFPPGRLERGARIMADPVQMDVIAQSLNSLRIRSVLDFFTRVGTNVALSYQLHRCLELTLQRHRDRHGQSQSQSKSHRPAASSLYPTRHPVAIVFVLLPVFVCVFVHQSVTTAATACAMHPECVVFARRWVTLRADDATQCPCRTLIAADEAPRIFATWAAPPDVTRKIAQLAATGDLETLKVVNRKLANLPDELRRCTKLKHITLYYTHTESLPEWVSEFTHLEYLLIEGKYRVSSLVSLPDGMFRRMHALASIHLGSHPLLLRLPSLRGLTALQSLSLALLLSLEELPPVNDLARLERIVFALMSSLQGLPDLAPLTNLQVFELPTTGPLCCNGFLDSAACDLHHPFCQLHALARGIAAAPTCLPMNRTHLIPTRATLDAVAHFRHSMCNVVPSVPDTVDDPVTPALVTKCNGTLFRACTISTTGTNRTGMCYSARFMPVACNTNILPIAMRRQQIRDGVGTACDPVEEAWLGCTH